MKRLFIVVEGQTEEAFVKELLAPHLLQDGVYNVTPVIIHTSRGHKGGFVNYDHLRNDVVKLLRSQKDDVIVSTFVDFFRCPTFPNQMSIDLLKNHHEMVEAMEDMLYKDVDDRRFLPYIQLHEFEALLFSSVDGFTVYFRKEITDRIQMIIDRYDNPEEINSSPDGAPSKRLINIISDYDKVVYGNLRGHLINFQGRWGRSLEVILFLQVREHSELCD